MTRAPVPHSNGRGRAHSLLLLSPLLLVLTGFTRPGFIDIDRDGWSRRDGDCQDLDASINPGALEVCDNIDNNCNGQINEGFDSDSDGIADCYDVEQCDGADNDGDGVIDEGFDVDGDGVGDCSGATFCSAADGFNLLGDDSPAVLTWDEHVSWTAELSGAAWIWDEYLETNPTGDDYRSILRDFSLPAGASAVSMSLEMAADNSYEVFVNGELVAADSSEYNYRGPTDVWDLSGAVEEGPNLLEFEIHNWAMAGGTAYTNPGGLLYCATVRFTLE